MYLLRKIWARVKLTFRDTSWIAVLMSMGPEATGAADGTSSPYNNGIHYFNWWSTRSFISFFIRCSTKVLYIPQHQTWWVPWCETSENNQLHNSFLTLTMSRPHTRVPICLKMLTRSSQKQKFWSEMCSHVDFVPLMCINAQRHFFPVTAIQIDGTRTCPSHQVTVHLQLP